VSSEDEAFLFLDQGKVTDEARKHLNSSGVQICSYQEVFNVVKNSVKTDKLRFINQFFFLHFLTRLFLE